ncbi:hypothetical protein J6590_031726 [Homalodisca vitripennis]|nr:hypothetical protein J6590_031726 [Homalodisca vitripennis]
MQFYCICLICCRLDIAKEGELSQIISVLQNEDLLTAVQMYEDVETSDVLQSFLKSLEEGQYITYMDYDEYVGSSVEVDYHETEEAADDIVGSKPYMCTECGQHFSNNGSFKSHLSTHQNKDLFCNYCNLHYKRIDHLQKHIEQIHRKSNTFEPKERKVNAYVKTFLCNMCGKILKSSITYENHMLKHQSKCPYSCDLCPETFPNRGARRKHEVKVHNILIKENGNTDGYHVCEVCGLELFSDGGYYHHKDKHGDPYPCPHCGKLYASRSLMLCHIRRHTNERPFACTLCDRNFKIKQELNAHMKIHKDVRPYHCPYCPKTCRKNTELTNHIRTHTGEKPYICDICGRGFAQAGDMRKHRQLHFRPSKINKTTKKN